MKIDDTDAKCSEAETIRRREDALKRMLNTPHKAHAELKKKRKPNWRKTSSGETRKSD